MSFDERHRRFMRHFDPTVPSHVAHYKANMARLGRCIGYGCDKPRTPVKQSEEAGVFVGNVKTQADLPKQQGHGVHMLVLSEPEGERGRTAQNTHEHCDDCVQWLHGLTKFVSFTKDDIFCDKTPAIEQGIRDMLWRRRAREAAKVFDPLGFIQVRTV